MTDHYDEMRVPSDPELAEALRRRLHAQMASATVGDHEGRSHLQLDANHLEPDAHLVPVKKIDVSVKSPTSEARNRRRLAIAAAAIVAVVGVAAIAVNIMNSGDDVKPASPTATTVAPTTVELRRETGARVNATYNVPDGWEHTGFGVTKGDPEIGMTIDAVGTGFYTSYCVEPGALPAGRTRAKPESVGSPIGPTVDDLVSAWADLPGVDATAARDVTIDGFAGKQIEFTVPDYDAGDCNGVFGFCAYGEWTWCESYLRDKDFSSDRSYQPLPHQYLKILVLDVNGTRHMILAGSSPDTSPQDRAALDEIVASIQFGAPAAPTTTEPATVESTIVGPTTGTFVMSGADLAFAVPAGWNYNGWYVANGNWSMGVFFDIVANIYTDSCPSELVAPPVGPTVDDLASAWVSLPGFNATDASDITVGGYHGKQIEFTVPDYDETLCSHWDFKLLEAEGGGAYWAQGPNQHHRLWILDVNGTRLVIAATHFPDASPQDRAVLDEILASIQIG